MTEGKSSKGPRSGFASEPNRGIWKHWNRSVPGGCGGFSVLLVTNLDPFATSRFMALRETGCETVRADSVLNAELAMQGHFDVVVLGHELKAIEKRTLARVARHNKAKVIWMYKAAEHGTGDADVLLAVDGEPENLLAAVRDIVSQTFVERSREARRSTAL